MKTGHLLSALIIAAGTLPLSQSALASYGQGDFFTRIGVAKVAPKSDNANVGGADLDVDAAPYVGLNSRISASQRIVLQGKRRRQVLG